jgi:hypothetical protein
MTEPSLEGLLQLLKQKKLVSIVTEISEGTTTFIDCMRRTEAQWKEIVGKTGGIDIFNYLNPMSGGNESTKNDNWTFGKLLNCKFPDLDKRKSRTTNKTGTAPTYPREFGEKFVK